MQLTGKPGVYPDCVQDRQLSPGQPKSKERPIRGELDLIRFIQSRAARASAGLRTGLQVGIGDDCALIRPTPREEIVVTTDFSLEGRHFRRDWHSPQSVGHRTLARGLSDLAAMGARPVAAFLSLALPKAFLQETSWLEGFFDGLLSLAQQAKVPLAGGDTAEAPGREVLADIVLLGAVPRGKALRRSGGKAGDRIFVTGTLGGAAFELVGLMSAARRKRTSPPLSDPAAQHPHFFPQPRLQSGMSLMRKHLATAAIDLSDGLSVDLRHLCEASGCCAEIEGAALPPHPLLVHASADTRLQSMLHGGEDYELLFTAPAMVKVPRRLGNVPLTEIGRLVPCTRGRSRITLIDTRGKRSPLPARGWEHLR